MIGCGIKETCHIFITKMFIDQSKATVDLTILFCKALTFGSRNHNNASKGFVWNEKSTFDSCPLSISHWNEIQNNCLFQKLKLTVNGSKSSTRMGRGILVPIQTSIFQMSKFERKMIWPHELSLTDRSLFLFWISNTYFLFQNPQNVWTSFTQAIPCEVCTV